MGQIRDLAAQYAGQIAILAALIAPVLFAVTLHRIKRIEKMLQKICGMPAQQECTLPVPEESGPVQEAQEVQTAQASPPQVEISPKEEFPSDAAELLGAVLGELFP